MISPVTLVRSTTASLLILATCDAADSPSPGDMVRVTKGAMLQSEGRNLMLAPKRGEWLVLRSAAGRDAVEVSFLKEDGAVIAATLPMENVELCPPDGAVDLQGAMDAFAAMQVGDARRLFERATADGKTKVLAGALGARVMGAVAASQRAGAGRQAFVNTLQTLRDSALQLAQAGRLGLALAMDQGADKLAAQALQNAPGAPPTKLDRADVERRVGISTKAVRQARQAFALRKLVAASKAVTEGLVAEPTRPELAALAERMKKDMAEADDCWVQADKMRTRGQKGVIHALSSLDDGIRLCADHPKLLVLRSAMQSEFEGRTSPQVTDQFLAITKGAKAAMEEGRKLYTTRCTECHDLEMLDTRAEDGWQRTVSGMSRRAGLDSGGQGKIIAYLAAALKYVESTGGE